MSEENNEKKARGAQLGNRNAKGGRKPGQKNVINRKVEQSVKERLLELDCDPIEGMASLVGILYEQIAEIQSSDLRGRLDVIKEIGFLYKELAKYSYRQLRQQEIVVDNTESPIITPTIVFSTPKPEVSNDKGAE